MFVPSINLRRSSRLASSSTHKQSTLPSTKKQKTGTQKKRPSFRKMAGTSVYEYVLIDIEGTTTPISFVHSVLFPYVDRVLDEYIANTYSSLSTQEDIATLTKQSQQASEVEKGAPPIIGSPDDKSEHVKSVVENVRWQMANDQKTTALKKLQGHIWTAGYQSGAFKGELFPDVARCLKEWKEAGLKLYVYSSGSVEAQQLLFGYSTDGDLCSLFSGYFDTNIGGKKELGSYIRIARELKCSSDKIMFLTDIYDEAEAAVASGMAVTIMNRPGNHRALAKGALSLLECKTFDQVSKRMFKEI